MTLSVLPFFGLVALQLSYIPVYCARAETRPIQACVSEIRRQLTDVLSQHGGQLKSQTLTVVDDISPDFKAPPSCSISIGARDRPFGW